jgi:hypothetical protein
MTMMNLNSLPADPEDKGEAMTEEERHLGEAKQESKAEKPASKPATNKEASKPKADKPKVETAAHSVGFTEGSRWNLGGTTYFVSVIHDDGSVTFTPVGSSG